MRRSSPALRATRLRELTTSGLGLHVEAGLPLDEPDVEQVWWPVDILADAGLLRDVPV